jgi:hypothetical protein
MSLPLIKTPEADGTLHYSYQDLAIRVGLHRRNGSKKYPVELLYKGNAVLPTDANLRELRDIQALAQHANELAKHPDWYPMLVSVAGELPETAETPWTPVVKTLSDYAFARKRYLWFPVLPEAEPVSIEGDPGCGKSAVVIKLICHLTTGTAFPTLFPDHPEEDFTPSHVILFSSEDDPSTTIKLRVGLNGGNPALVHIVEGKKSPDTGDVAPMTMSDLTLIADLLTTYKPALLVFDPVQSFFGMVDMNKASETRPTLDAVRHVCKTHGCTPLYVRHNGKAQRSKAIHSSIGSIDITAHMRSVLALFKDPDDETRRILAQSKTNGRLAPSIQLTLVGTTCDVDLDSGTETLEDVEVTWDGLSDLSAEDLNARENAHGNDTEEANASLDQAREFLRDLLKNGPMLVQEINDQAGQAGITRSTLRRAKDKEKIKAVRQAVNGTPYTKSPWAWQMKP